LRKQMFNIIVPSILNVNETAKCPIHLAAGIRFPDENVG
jgi:hypothetical protein